MNSKTIKKNKNERIQTIAYNTMANNQKVMFPFVQRGQWITSRYLPYATYIPYHHCCEWSNRKTDYANIR